MATPASAKEKDRKPAPTLLSDTTQSWITGSSQWLNLTWTADSEIEDLKVTATSTHRDVSIAYSVTTDDHAGLSEDTNLSANEIDYTAIHITTGDRTPKNFLVKVEATWTVDGERYSGKTNLRLRGEVFEGDAFAVMTETVDVSVADAANSWVELDYKGLAPQTDEFVVSVSGEVPIYHPQEDFTSLHHDDTLVVGETDAARVWLDPDVVRPGTYKVTVRIDYSVSGKDERLEHVVKLNVTG